jgi:CRP-like cAMP-binding protein
MLLYKYCDPEWHSYLDFHISERKFSAGDCIFKEKHPVDYIMFLKKGNAKVSIGEDNHEKIIRFASSGDIIGHRGLGSKLTYAASCYALTNSEVYVLPINIFNNLLSINGKLAHRMMIFFADELRNSEFNNRTFIDMTVLQRIARAILYFKKVFGINDASQKLNYTPSKKELASYVNTSYESVVRTLKSFEDNHIISFSKKEIHIKDEKQLLHIIDTDEIHVAKL